MVQCDFPECTERIEYLPFQCRYCNQTFCKKHRLPENHGCTFEVKVSPKDAPKSRRGERRERTEAAPMYGADIPKDTGDKKFDKEMRTFVRREEKRQKKAERQRRPTFFQRANMFGRTNKLTATYVLIGLNIFFFILNYFFRYYIKLNVSTFVFNYYFHTLLTAMFGPGSPLSLLFSVFMLYWIGKTIERQYGTKFLFLIYVLAGVTTGALTLIFQFLYSYIPSAAFASAIFGFYSSESGASNALLTFLIFTIGLERELRFYLLFIPIRLKGKHVLWLIGGMSILGGLLGSPASLASLIGIYIGKKLFGIASKRTINNFSNRFW